MKENLYMVVNLSRIKDDVEEVEYEAEQEKDLPRKRRTQRKTSMGVPCVPIGMAEGNCNYEDEYDIPYFSPREIFIGLPNAKKQIAKLQRKYAHIEWGLFTLTHTTGEPDVNDVKLTEV